MFTYRANFFDAVHEQGASHDPRFDTILPRTGTINSASRQKGHESDAATRDVQHAQFKPEWHKFAQEVKRGALVLADDMSPGELQNLSDWLATSPREPHTAKIYFATLDEACVQLLTSGLERNTRLEHLSLAGNDIGRDKAVLLAQVVKSNASPRELKLLGNRIEGEGASALAEALKFNATLDSLALYNAGIGDEGCATLSRMLEINKSLRTLNIGTNGIGLGRMRPLSQALMDNWSLRELNLSINQIGDDGAALLSKALKSNASLNTVALSENGIDPAGTASIAEALKINQALKALDVSGNAIGNEGVNLLSEALEQDSVLETLTMSMTGIDADVAPIHALHLSSMFLWFPLTRKPSRFQPLLAFAALLTLFENETKFCIAEFVFPTASKAVRHHIFPPQYRQADPARRHP